MDSCSENGVDRIEIQHVLALTDNGKDQKPLQNYCSVLGAVLL